VNRVKAIHKAVRAWLLKLRLRRLYARYCDQADGYDCGIALAEHISPELSYMRARMDALLAELQALERGES